MKKGGVLHPQLNRILAETGHTDMLTICDRGFPVPLGVERVDLALTDDLPGVTDALRAIAGEFVIDCLIITEEMQAFSPERVALLKELMPDVRWKVLPHVRFKQLCRESRAVIRTGDTTPYANLIIVSG
ncbi:D-ribose pyranase [Paenibacillus melissococcoides]|uniref:D-ribose pyranase n=1 Tax=Paenibacillus melissococcoides TaxID=2912268 RepID=A0ABM9G1F8_9BACL|nr:MULTISPECIES: D-ribose pyranase [Paenibacillus]MEB9893723.1 D-ribose pyranase [Bacillus cereus]CAH8245424.1 D-ribose pyranase [Paenibacillus melissococcoides]CAH8710904.1 D-ribose pyranase [Paenibacillus melissococcoides]CAH8711705.1 D-ribose pyranase [Paenibacillus melissococcoides]GIO77677.1 D-ribose pyranase [Paenibacillus dendritiformis]